MKTKVFLLACFIMIFFQMSAQNSDEVSLIVSADGATKDEAVKTALRSAIEQAYGTFVSANTTILNDELVKDEVVTLSLGNIKSYKELSSEVLPNNNVFVTLQATVSISKLVNYAQSKGAEAEFAGATFAMNLKMEELNTRNEEKIIANTLSIMEKLYMAGFDYKISVSNVQADGQVTAEIDAYANENGQKAYELFYNTLENISLNQNKIDEYTKLNKKVYTISFYEKLIPENRNEFKKLYTYTFRSEKTLMFFNQFFNFIYPKTLLNICIGTDVMNSQIQLISSSSSHADRRNENVYGDNISKKKIFQQRIPTQASYFYGDFGATAYIRSYIAKEHILNYIRSIDEIKNFCYFAYNHDIWRDTSNAFIVGYPKNGVFIHQQIRLIMQIPLDDLMKISKFTITRNNE